MEAFGAASVKKVVHADSTSDRFSVTFELSKKTVEWDPQCGNLLEFAEKNGVSLDFGCRAGNCGTCEIKINSGDIAYEIESGAAPGEGACLACITAPTSDLSIEA
jgi:ferredoxin